MELVDRQIDARVSALPAAAAVDRKGWFVTRTIDYRQRAPLLVADLRVVVVVGNEKEGPIEDVKSVRQS